MTDLPQADYDIQQSKFFIVTSSSDGVTWNDDEIVEHTPIPRVRQLLGGRWEVSKSYGSFMKAFFNGKKRVVVLGMKPSTTKEEAIEALKKIREGREDRN